METFDCDYCREEAEHPASCPVCEGVFCPEHVDDHYCEEAVVVLRLSNGSIYDMRVPSITRGLYDRFDGDGALSTFARSLSASPVTLGFLCLIWLWFAFQFGWLVTLGHSEMWDAVFVLDSMNIDYVWTWFTHILSHGGLIHAGINSIVLVMFGPIVEHHLGRKKYAALIVLGGVAAGVSQAGAGTLLNVEANVVGASGAIAAILGLYATVEPDMRVYLIGIIPMPLWFAAVLLGGGSFLIAAQFGIVAFSIAHLAHGVGIVFGVLFGLTTDRTHLQEYIHGIRSSQSS